METQNSEIVIYEASDGTTKLQVQLEDETVWLTQEQIQALFAKSKATISEHIKNVFEEDELEKNQLFGISEQLLQMVKNMLLIFTTSM